MHHPVPLLSATSIVCLHHRLPAPLFFHCLKLQKSSKYTPMQKAPDIRCSTTYTRTLAATQACTHTYIRKNICFILIPPLLPTGWISLFCDIFLCIDPAIFHLSLLSNCLPSLHPSLQGQGRYMARVSHLLSCCPSLAMSFPIHGKTSNFH